MNDALAKMLNEIQQIRNTPLDTVGAVSDLAVTGATNLLPKSVVDSLYSYENNPSSIGYKLNEFLKSNKATEFLATQPRKSYDNQEMQMFNEMLNNAPTGGSSVGNMSDIEYMRANNPTYSPTTREEMVRKNMEYNANIREMRALQHKGASGMGLLSDAEVARFQQLQRGIGNVSDRENITLQEMIDVIGKQRNPYVDPYADAPGPTNEDLSARDREFLRQIGINNTNETYYNNLKNYRN